MGRRKDATRTLPSSHSAEMALLGSCLLDARKLDDVGHVRPEHFYYESNAMIWRALSDMRSAGRSIDVVTLAEELGRRGWLPIGEQSEADTGKYLLEVMEAVPHAYHAASYAEDVLRLAKRRTVVAAAESIAVAGYDISRDVDELVRDAESNLHQVLMIGQQTGPAPIDDLLRDALESLASDRPQGIPTNWFGLDEKFLGWCPGHLVIVAARPGMGKTAFAIQCAERVAESRRPILFITIEMTRLEIAERILARNACVPEFVMRKRLTTPEQNEELVRQGNMLSRLPFVVEDQVSQLNAVLSTIRLAKRRYQIDLVVIDYLQLIQNQRGHNREQQIAEVSRALKSAAKENQVCIVALSQINRDVEKREDKTPRLGDLRESGAIEQDADCVMFLHRPGVYDPTVDPQEARVVIAKQRAGPTGNVRMEFDGQTGRFWSRDQVSLAADLFPND